MAYANPAERIPARNMDAAPLGDYYQAIQGRINGNDNDIPTLRQSSLTNYGINWYAITYEKGSCAPNRPKVVDGDVLLAAMAHEAHYLGRRADFIKKVPDEFRECNQVIHHLMILRHRDDLEERGPNGPFLASFLRHPCGMYQVQRCNRGVRGDHVRSDDLERYVMVPKPSQDWQNDFDQLILKSEKARIKSKKLQLSAEREIETWIENQ